MKNSELNVSNLPSPAFVCEVVLLEKNLQLLKYVQEKADIKILLALKGFALKSTFELCRQYLKGCCASGLNEAKLAYEEFKGEVHTYSPAFKPSEFEEISKISNHIVFNSFNELDRYKNKVKPHNSLGLRINPEYSTVEVDLYNPCGLYSRLGITKKEFDKNKSDDLISMLDGFHFHALCEQNFDVFEGAFLKFEANFKEYFKDLKWLNFGGGHHITRDDYDVDGLIEFLKMIRKKYPHLTLYMEPGEAVGWQTGYLEATVLDIVHNEIDIAILDTSAECHMPDTLAMPYKAEVRGASSDPNEKQYKYRLGGNTCLAGDIMGDYSFDKPLEVGDKIIFEDMIHYTMVKTTTFNGINLPSIVLRYNDDKFEKITDFDYNNYKSRI
jgi:carboxynorspermidine decarboxylase